MHSLHRYFKTQLIRPRSGIGKIELVEEFVRGLGNNPGEILARNALAEPDTKFVDPKSSD